MSSVKVQRKNDFDNLYINEWVHQTLTHPFIFVTGKNYFAAPPIQEKILAETEVRYLSCTIHQPYSKIQNPFMAQHEVGRQKSR